MYKRQLAAFDRIVGLELDDIAVDGSIHKAPCGGEGTGKSLSLIHISEPTRPY